MKDGLLRDDSLSIIAYRITGVHVTIQMRKVAARHMDPQAMAGLHSPGGVGQIDLVLLDGARLQKDLFVEAMAEASASAALAHEHRTAIGEDINQLGHKVGILCTTCSIQPQDNRADDIERFVKDLVAVTEHVLARLHVLLVERARDRLA